MRTSGNILARPTPELYSATLDVDVSAWLAAVRAVSSVSAATVASVGRLVRGLKQSGIWNSVYMLDCCCGDNLTAALVRVKVPAGVSRSYTAFNFVEGNYTERGTSGGLIGGAGKYLGSGVNPVALGFSVSSLGLWAYTRTTAPSGTTQITLGSVVTPSEGNFAILGWVVAGSKEAGTIAGTSSNYPEGAATSRTGLLGLQVSGSRNAQFFRNGAALGLPAGTASTSGFLNAEFFVHAQNNNGTPGAYCSRRLSTKLITSGLTSGQAATLNSLVQAFEGELGRAV